MLRTCFSASSHDFLCSRLIHENQMNLKFIWCHYCFHDLYDIVVAYNLFK
jgi:hypothetical protein